MKKDELFYLIQGLHKKNLEQILKCQVLEVFGLLWNDSYTSVSWFQNINMKVK